MLHNKNTIITSFTSGAVKRKQFTRTGHRYLGNGNPLRNGDPVDEDDGIAKSHDEAYERATSHEDVFAADQASAALFLNDFRRTDNWHSPLGVCRVKEGDTNNPMKPQSYTSLQEKDHANVAKSYWGLKFTPGNEEQNGDEEKSIPECTGVLQHNFAYDFIHIDKASSRLTKFVNQFLFKSHVGTPIVNYEYQFGGDAWLKMGPTYNAGNELLTRTQLGLPTDVVSYTTSNLSNYESYEQKPDLNVTMRLRPNDVHMRHVKYLVRSC
ncbi:hypothetical protein MRX96_008464 [Rhipicephalus microplus]